MAEGCRVAAELLHLPDKPAGAGGKGQGDASPRTASPAGQAGRGVRRRVSCVGGVEVPSRSKFSDLKPKVTASPRGEVESNRR